MREIAPSQVQAWLGDGTRKAPLLLDVREPWEFAICHLPGSRHMPMSSIPARAPAELAPEDEIVVICHHGARSLQVAMFLERTGFGNVYNLSGGIDAWSKQVDPAMPTY